jgi:hypothetical protein
MCFDMFYIQWHHLAKTDLWNKVYINERTKAGLPITYYKIQNQKVYLKGNFKIISTHLRKPSLYLKKHCHKTLPQASKYTALLGWQDGDDTEKIVASTTDNKHQQSVEPSAVERLLLGRSVKRLIRINKMNRILGMVY